MAQCQQVVAYRLAIRLQLYFGCGLAQCGACTVHYDGKALPCCVMPISAVAGANIVTLNGLGTAEKPHPVQQAFIDEQAQCGYCINGMIMQAAAFLAQNARCQADGVRGEWAMLDAQLSRHAFPEDHRRARGEIHPRAANASCSWAAIRASTVIDATWSRGPWPLKSVAADEVGPPIALGIQRRHAI